MHKKGNHWHYIVADGGDFMQRSGVLKGWHTPYIVSSASIYNYVV